LDCFSNPSKPHLVSNENTADKMGAPWTSRFSNHVFLFSLPTFCAYVTSCAHFGLIKSLNFLPKNFACFHLYDELSLREEVVDLISFLQQLDERGDL